MDDRDRIVAERVRFLAVAGKDDVVLQLEAGVSRLECGDARLALRLDPRALPIGDARLRATCAPLSLRAASGGDEGAAFAELLRATAPEGRIVVAEEDAQATVGAQHRAAAQVGWIPAPMEAVPVALSGPVRLFVAFKPAVERTATSERGHGTH